MRGERRQAVAAVAAVLLSAVLAILMVSSRAVTTATSWATYGGGLTSANIVASRGLTVASAGRMQAIWTTRLDGPIFAGPVIDGRGRGRVVVATEAGTLYALQAATGKVAWSRSITKPVAACGGSWGVSSTPTIDLESRTVYAIGASGFLTALSLTDGSVLWRMRLVRRTSVEYVWSAPRIVGRSAYVAVASYCDDSDRDGRPPDGYLLRVDLTRHTVSAKFDVVPGPDNLGGIWGWGGVSVDPEDGSLYTSTGNAVVTRHGDRIEDAGYAERILQLTPLLRVVDSTRPPEFAPTNRGDEDFGATPLLFHPSGCPPLVAANSKNGHTYIFRRGDLAGRPVWDATLGPTGPSDPFLGQPTYVPSLRLLLIAKTLLWRAWDPSRGLSAFRVGTNCTITKRWTLNIGGGPQPPPIAVGDVVAASAPATRDVKLVDARNGRILKALPTRQAVYAPLASDGTFVYSATVGGDIVGFAPVGEN